MECNNPDCNLRNCEWLVKERKGVQANVLKGNSDSYFGEGVLQITTERLIFFNTIGGWLQNVTLPFANITNIRIQPPSSTKSQIEVTAPVQSGASYVDGSLQIFLFGGQQEEYLNTISSLVAYFRD